MQKRLLQFQQYLLRWHAQYGRHGLPWRQSTDPYAILVSELMLQQTQVERVIPKYHAFLAAFPTVEKLAVATLPEVLTLWQGLGYNRRAKYLHKTAQTLIQTYGGAFPQTQQELQTLPGIGKYTAGAVMAFAYNKPVVMIETNIRAVFIHHFFPDQVAVSDTALLPLIEQSLPSRQTRNWYAALMDYGSHIKSVVQNPSRRSRQHVKQSKFTGSVRQVRGEIIRLLLQRQPQTHDELEVQLEGDVAHFDDALAQLQAEHMIVVENLVVRLGNG